MADVEKHPWITGNLAIDADVLEKVFAEARAAYGRDEESCGLLAGPAPGGAPGGDGARLLDEIIPMENRANKLHALDPVTYPRTGRMYFDINPMKFEREVSAREAAGRPVKVLYHSHLDVGAYFSETDAAAATMGGSAPTYDLAYLVTSVRAGVVDDHKLFIWSDATQGFVEAGLEVVGRP